MAFQNVNFQVVPDPYCVVFVSIIVSNCGEEVIHFQVSALFLGSLCIVRMG